MPDTSTPSPSDSSNTLTFLERFADQRLLVLLLCLVFYCDSWLITKEIDPTKIMLSQLSASVGNTSLFAAVLFILSFALLMSAVSPGVRSILGIARIYLQSKPNTERGRTKDRRQLSDWSLTWVTLVAIDLVLGLISGGYGGISLFLAKVFTLDGIGVFVLRISVVLFLLVSFSRGIEIDEA